MGLVNKFKNQLMTRMQNFSKAIVVPVLFLPVIGIVIAVSSLIINDSIINILPFLRIKPLQIFVQVVHKSLMVFFQNLGPLFAIGITLGLVEKRKEQAALISFMSFFLYLSAQNTYLDLTDSLATAENMIASGQTMSLGFQVIDMGVFIGIIIGLIVSAFFNKYSEKDLGNVLSVYGGPRYVFLLLIPIMISLAIVNTWWWPSIQNLLSVIAETITSTGGFGYFLFGFLERLLIPTGLHHILGSAIWYTELGGSQIIAGERVVGAWNIAITELNNPEILRLSTTAIFNNTNFVKMFGLTGAGIAMISVADKDKLSEAKAVLIPAMFTSLFTAITEPIEFTFLFLSPLLFFIHSLLTGFFFYLLKLLDIVTISSGGIIEMLALTMPHGNAKTNYINFFLLGIVQLVVYFFVFRWFILKFNLATPGREGGINKLITKKDFEESKDNNSSSLGRDILLGLGGANNIKKIDNCFTRLRLEVVDSNLIDENRLVKTGAQGTIIKEKNVQVVYGPQVERYRVLLEEEIERRG